MTPNGVDFSFFSRLVYLDRKSDIVCELFPSASRVLEALDVQQQHLGKTA